MKYQEAVARNFAGHLRKRLRRLLKAALSSAVREARKSDAVSQSDQFDAAVSCIVESLRLDMLHEEHSVHRRRSVLEPLFGMPPARRSRSAVRGGPTLTLVERRAVAAKKKVQQWKRKQKLAATKVALYSKKVRYYTKKGVIR